MQPNTEIYKLDKDTFEIIGRYRSITIASKDVDVSASNICIALNNIRTTSGGYRWVRVLEYKKIMDENKEYIANKRGINTNSGINKRIELLLNKNNKTITELFEIIESRASKKVKSICDISINRLEEIMQGDSCTFLECCIIAQALNETVSSICSESTIFEYKRRLNI